MSYAFRCPETGLTDFCDAPGLQACASCGGRHRAFQAGAPHIVKRDFSASAAVQTYKPRVMHGELVTSRRQEDALDAAHGIATITEREANDMSPKPDTKRFPRRRI